MKFPSVQQESSSVHTAPNPFDVSTELKFSVPEAGADVTIIIYNNLGVRIQEYSHSYAGGEHIFTINLETEPAGVYHYKILIGDLVESGKIILQK
ncbi:MAG: T9SS type A sorting domain-containing protein [Candidatus Kapaibacterium sp.]